MELMSALLAVMESFKGGRPKINAMCVLQGSFVLLSTTCHTCATQELPRIEHLSTSAASAQSNVML